MQLRAENVAGSEKFLGNKEIVFRKQRRRVESRLVSGRVSGVCLSSFLHGRNGDRDRSNGEWRAAGLAKCRELNCR